MKDIGQRFASLRKALKMNQADFSQASGCGRNTLTMIETGRNNPTSTLIANVCQVFNVDANWLLLGTGEMYIDKSQKTACKVNDIRDVFEAYEKVSYVQQRLFSYSNAPFQPVSSVKSCISTLNDALLFLSSHMKINLD